MGLFWELFQQSQISDQEEYARNLEDRVISLEKQLHHTRTILNRLIGILEEKYGRDIDGDGKIG
jgi:hypothetical protein